MQWVNSHFVNIWNRASEYMTLNCTDITSITHYKGTVWLSATINSTLLSSDDGKLSFEEFKAYFSDGVLTVDELQELFHTIDTHNTE